MFMPAVNVFMQAAHCTDANRRVHCHNVNMTMLLIIMVVARCVGVSKAPTVP